MISFQLTSIYSAPQSRYQFVVFALSIMTLYSITIFRKDAFLIETKNLGKLNAINIRHDNSWFGSGWYLEKVHYYKNDK